MQKVFKSIENVINHQVICVTGFAKTWHNGASLNLQYKPLIHKILVYLKKKISKFFSCEEKV